MPSKFTTGFKKSAGVLGTIGKAVSAIGGGPLNTVLTGADAVSNFAKASKKMSDAATR